MVWVAKKLVKGPKILVLIFIKILETAKIPENSKTESLFWATLMSKKKKNP